jgi:LPS-assembly lipoprotein
MSSPLKVLAAFSLLILAACGFTPMYGSGAGSSGVSAPQGLDKVDIALIPDESGVYLRNLLIDSFYRGGYPSSPTHVLQVENLNEHAYSLDITRESEATRKQIRLTATLTLTDRATGKPVLTRPLTAITSYNVLGSQFTTRVSENDAREAALTDLARQIETQTALYFKR